MKEMQATYKKGITDNRNKYSKSRITEIMKQAGETMAVEKVKTTGPRDEWSFKTHFIGIIFGVFATIFMWADRWGQGTGTVASFVIFGLSIIALYTCSSIYHYYNGPAETLVRLRKLDHSMIYVLIAGSYTPVLYNCLEPSKGMIFLAVMWMVAAAGVIIKVFWLDAPRWLYTSMYILMGWAIVVDPKALMTLDPRCLWLLVAGGLSYTVGAVFYIIKKPNISEKFGFHELFHCFILLGTVFHFVGMALFI